MSIEKRCRRHTNTANKWPVPNWPFPFGRQDNRLMNDQQSPPGIRSSCAAACQNSNYLSTCDTIDKTKVALLYLLRESFLAKAVTYADLLQALCQFGPSLEQSCEALKSWRQFRGTGSSWPKTIVHISV